jgi:hypothetical protein
VVCREPFYSLDFCYLSFGGNNRAWTFHAARRTSTLTNSAIGTNNENVCWALLIATSRSHRRTRALVKKNWLCWKKLCACTECCTGARRLLLHLASVVRRRYPDAFRCHPPKIFGLFQTNNLSSFSMLTGPRGVGAKKGKRFEIANRPFHCIPQISKPW